MTLAPASNGATALAVMRATLRPHHDSIERSLDLMSAGVDRPRYVRFIERSYGFVAACERRLDLSGAPPQLRAGSRLKTALLRANLVALQHTAETIDRLPVCDRVPPVDRWPAALGYFYVMEGSTLGGQILSRHFRRSLGLNEPELGFLAAYGSNTGPMWKGMIDVLEAAMSNAAHCPAITECARATFTLLEEWHSLRHE